MDNYFMKVPRKHCPYRNDVKPFLRPERGEELAYLATNPYNTFHCHKTTVSTDDEDGEMGCDENTKLCAGFLTLQEIETGEKPEGFEPSYEIVYSEAYEMVDAYAQANV